MSLVSPPPPRRVFAFFFVLLVGILPLAPTAFARVFTDLQGRTVEAEFRGVEDGVVILEQANGGILRVPLAQLSAADRAALQAGNPGTSPAASTAAPEATPAPTEGEPLDWSYDAKPRGIPGLGVARFRFWLPDAKRPVLGMIVLTPGSNGDGRGDAVAADWQALARELDFGLVACMFQGTSPNDTGYCYAANGSGKVLIEAIDALAGTQGRPEVASAPLLLWGHSAGGQFNYNFACWKPERTLAFIVNKGGVYYDTPSRPATRAVPAILFAGENDTAERVRNIGALFTAGRSKGALWALCTEKGVGHDVGQSRAIAQQFFRSIVKARLVPPPGSPPKRLTIADGLLAIPGEPALPPGQFKGVTRSASWLPDAASVAAWAGAQ